MTAIFQRATDLADLLGLPVTTVKKMIRDGNIPYRPNGQGDYLLPGDAALALKAVMFSAQGQLQRKPRAKKKKDSVSASSSSSKKTTIKLGG